METNLKTANNFLANTDPRNSLNRQMTKEEIGKMIKILSFQKTVFYLNFFIYLYMEKCTNHKYAVQ